jgi:hypothetical protein
VKGDRRFRRFCFSGVLAIGATHGFSGAVTVIQALSSGVALGVIFKEWFECLLMCLRMCIQPSRNKGNWESWFGRAVVVACFSGLYLFVSSDSLLRALLI